MLLALLENQTTSERGDKFPISADGVGTGQGVGREGTQQEAEFFENVDRLELTVV